MPSEGDQFDQRRTSSIAAPALPGPTRGGWRAPAPAAAPIAASSSRAGARGACAPSTYSRATLPGRLAMRQAVSIAHSNQRHFCHASLRLWSAEPFRCAWPQEPHQAACSGAAQLRQTGAAKCAASEACGPVASGVRGSSSSAVQSTCRQHGCRTGRWSRQLLADDEHAACAFAQVAVACADRLAAAPGRSAGRPCIRRRAGVGGAGHHAADASLGERVTLPSLTLAITSTASPRTRKA